MLTNFEIEKKFNKKTSE